MTTRAGWSRSRSGSATPRHGIALGGGNAAQAGDAFAAITSDGGSTWTTRASPPLEQVSGVVSMCGATKPTVVAVGPAGAVWSKTKASRGRPSIRLNYWSVGFASPRAGWAVGTQGRITKLSGF